MKIYLFIALAAILFVSCNQAELDKSNQKGDSLTAVVNEREAALNEFITTFNDIESNLDSVAARQHIISASTEHPGELKPDQKTRINSEIAAINDLMEQNRKKIEELTHKLKNSSDKNAQLERTIATLTHQLAKKDMELKELNEQLISLNVQVAQLQTSVDLLTESNNIQTQKLSETTTELHTVYYIVAKSKELQEAKLIDRKGGLLGIGKTAKLTNDIDNSKFTQIDYTQTTSIPINSKDVKIITSHPSESYTLDKDEKDKKMVTNLTIINPEKFWSASKYLVVQKD